MGSLLVSHTMRVYLLGKICTASDRVDELYFVVCNMYIVLTSKNAQNLHVELYLNVRNPAGSS